MLGPRVCWQLLLGCALLLGQPVFGDSVAAEEPPVAESEEPVPVSQEAPEPEPELQEPEELVPESQELDELLLGKVTDMSGRLLSSSEREMIFGPSDKTLEKRAKQNRRFLERSRDNPDDGWMHHLKTTVLRRYNQENHYVHMLYDNGNVKVKKAIGTMIYITLLLVKTSCTKEEGEALIRERYLRYDYDDDDDDAEMGHKPASTERKRCEVPPISEQEIVECTFTLFKDARSRHWSRTSVSDYSCVPYDERHENY